MVSGFNGAEGDYLLWISCCYPEEVNCNGHGTVRHSGWGPPTADVCGCNCDYPFTGATCNQCSSWSLSVPLNNSCQNCFGDNPFDRFSRKDLVALHHSSVSWTPHFLDIVFAECLSAIRISSFSRSWSLVESVRSTDVGGLEIQMGACSDIRSVSSASLHISANGRVISAVICAPHISCPLARGSTRRLTADAHAPLFDMLMLQWNSEAAMAALSLLELLNSTADNVTFVIHDMWNQSYVGHGSDFMGVQAFFNLQLQNADIAQRLGCALPSEVAASGADSGLLVLVGSLCGTQAT